MRSKAPLAMMEQIVMLLVFALAAALCLQAFVRSDQMSQRSENRDLALLRAQSAAEAVRAARGDFAAAAALLGAAVYDENSLMLDYDENWDPADGAMRYTLGVSRVETDVPGLGRAGVWVRDEAAQEQDGELVRIEVCWQEVIDGG